MSTNTWIMIGVAVVAVVLLVVAGSGGEFPGWAEPVSKE